MLTQDMRLCTLVSKKLVGGANLTKEEWLICSFGQFCVILVCALKLVVRELVDGANLAKEEWLIEVVQRLVECEILTKEECRDWWNVKFLQRRSAEIGGM